MLTKILHLYHYIILLQNIFCLTDETIQQPEGKDYNLQASSGLLNLRNLSEDF